MTTYLTIITTVLVLTQIIRVTQNWIQLRNWQATDQQNRDLMRDWERILCRLEKLIDKGVRP
jgi:hypothetical protein